MSRMFRKVKDHYRMVPCGGLDGKWKIWHIEGLQFMAGPMLAKDAHAKRLELIHEA